MSNDKYEATFHDPASSGPPPPPPPPMQRNEPQPGLLMRSVRLWVVPAAAVLALAVGIGVGSATAPTPQSCLDYVDLSAEAFGYAADALGAAADFNIPGIDRASADMDAISPDLLESQEQCAGDDL